MGKRYRNVTWGWCVWVSVTERYVGAGCLGKRITVLNKVSRLI